MSLQFNAKYDSQDRWVAIASNAAFFLEKSRLDRSLAVLAKTFTEN